MRRLVYFAAASLGVVAIVSTSVWLGGRSEIERLMATDSIENETGLILPSGARIAAARADIFSLADGDNYDWLIESEASLLPWVSANP